jgi:hypothetical protein
VCEATRRDIDILRHCERAAGEFGVTLAAAIEEWVSAWRTPVKFRYPMPSGSAPQTVPT